MGLVGHTAPARSSFDLTTDSLGGRVVKQLADVVSKLDDGGSVRAHLVGV